MKEKKAMFRTSRQLRPRRLVFMLLSAGAFLALAAKMQTL